MKIRTILLVALSAALLCTVSCKKDKKGFNGTSVDLGLSVKWATLNVDATSKDDVGTLMDYTSAKDYAALSRKWSIPTALQWAELLTSGKVQVEPNVSPKGFTVFAEDGATIFLPAGKYLVADLQDGKEIGYVDLSMTSAPSSITWTGSTDGDYCIRMVRK